jgi:type IV pilus assembly protein PilC
MLAQHATAPLLQKVIATLQQTIEAGQPLSSGLRQFKHLIDPLTCHLIYVAEETGTLDTILHRISDYQEQRLALTNRIKQALFYPALIVIAAIIVSLTMLLFVIPRFAELFANFHAELPLLTRVIVHFSHLIRHDGWLGVIPLAGLYYGYRYYRDPARQSVLQQGLFKLPGFGPFAKKLLLARFTRTLATLLSAGIPITDALKMLIQATHFKLYQIAVSSLHQEITAGMRLHQAMQQNTLFPPLLIQMIQVGEESGSLDRMLANSAEFYEAEIDYWLKNLGNLLEPLIIIVLGVLIGGIVIAMYLPIFQLGTVM